jgi:hypothetical protein
MADTTDISTEQTPTTTAGPSVPVTDGPGPAAPERTLPRGPVIDGMSGNGRPSDPDEMRQEIDRTRQRISFTLDSIEDQLVRRKQEVWAKATFQPVRRAIAREPWRSMAIAFAVGYIVAAIRGWLWLGSSRPRRSHTSSASGNRTSAARR